MILLKHCRRIRFLYKRVLRRSKLRFSSRKIRQQEPDVWNKSKIMILWQTAAEATALENTNRKKTTGDDKSTTDKTTCFEEIVTILKNWTDSQAEKETTSAPCRKAAQVPVKPKRNRSGNGGGWVSEDMVSNK